MIERLWRSQSRLLSPGPQAAPTCRSDPLRRYLETSIGLSGMSRSAAPLRCRSRRLLLR